MKPKDMIDFNGGKCRTENSLFINGYYACLFPAPGISGFYFRHYTHKLQKKHKSYSRCRYAKIYKIRDLKVHLSKFPAMA